ncbi:hypothetical protein BD311DRAFT_452556 [Dichomitus squalens]|uniref:Uncharacterized protein n=1 Tax=Dichomitus squalens TaxID=114155 RepID=A0A4Q9MJH0_9APHY|nr:hypothetical protein BD311DRAFT_452556 [Dichomitus squalens]
MFPSNVNPTNPRLLPTMQRNPSSKAFPAALPILAPHPGQRRGGGLGVHARPWTHLDASPVH